MAPNCICSNTHLHAQLLDPSFGIPPDVTFNIVKTTKDNGGESNEDGIEVKGHKMLLSLFSPVFKRQFYGATSDGTKNNVTVKETTKDAFEKMLHFVYSIDIDWSAMTVEELYDVVNLAEKYQIDLLMKEVKIQLENFPLTMENLMEVAVTADEYKQFPDVTSVVIQSCAKFLNSSLQSKEAILKFAAEQVGKDQGAVGIKLLALAHSHSLLNLCKNCSGDPCHHGEEVSSLDKVSEGCKLIHNKRCQQYWGTSTDDRYFTVSRSFPTELKVRVMEASSGVFNCPLSYNGDHLFIYNCK